MTSPVACSLSLLPAAVIYCIPVSLLWSPECRPSSLITFSLHSGPSCFLEHEGYRLSEICFGHSLHFHARLGIPAPPFFIMLPLALHPVHFSCFLFCSITMFKISPSVIVVLSCSSRPSRLVVVGFGSSCSLSRYPLCRFGPRSFPFLPSTCLACSVWPYLFVLEKVQMSFHYLYLSSSIISQTACLGGFGCILFLAAFFPLLCPALFVCGLLGPLSQPVLFFFFLRLPFHPSPSISDTASLSSPSSPAHW